MRLHPPLGLEIAAARGVAALSRRLGAGGGTTIPGKLLAKLDRGAIDRLAARLPAGTAVVSATNGKTTTTAMAAEILRPRHRLAHNAAGANLVSGVASTLLAAGDAELGLFEVDEGALPELVRRLRPRAVCLGNLFRDQLDRYGELELVAERWRDAVAALPADGAARLQRRRPAARRGRRGASRAASRSASTIRASRVRRSSTRPTRSTASAAARRTTTPPRTSAISATTAARTAITPGRRSRSPRGTSRCRGSSALRSCSSRRRARAGSSSRLPGLYNVYNAVAAAALARALGASLDEIAAGLERFSAAFGRFERIAVGDKRILLLLIKNPAGANEAVRTLVDGGAPRLVVVALNDEIADGRDVSWIWDVDFEPLLAGPRDARRERGPRRRARAPLPLRRPRRGRDRGRARPRAARSTAGSR